MYYGNAKVKKKLLLFAGLLKQAMNALKFW